MSEQLAFDMAEVGLDVPQGYKRTEVGVIPEDWHVDRLGKIGKFKNGINKSANDFGFGSPFVNLMDVFGKPEINGSESFGLINSSELDKKEYSIETGDVLFIRSSVKPSGVGLTTVVTCDLKDVVYSGFLIRFRTDERISLEFKKHCFYESSFRKKIIAGSTISANTNINQNVLKEICLAFPVSQPEQTAIATALSDVDALINELEQLIAKKQAIKTATMQQLLTGRTRLPQFILRDDGTPKGYKASELGEIPEDWEVKEIGDFAPLQRGFDLPAGQRKEGIYPVVYSNGIVNTHNKFQVKGAGVVTGRSGTLGKVHYVEDDYWPHNTSLWVTRFNGSNSKFVYFLFTYIGFERFASGSGVPTLNRNDAHSFKVEIPSQISEQTAIATILTDMDSDISNLQQRLSKARQIKQGMMQQLLTGHIRLI